MAASNVYEIRCENCKTTFAPETKRCIHCGGPLGAGLGRLLTSPRAPGRELPDEEAADELPFQRGRGVTWIVTAVVAVVLTALRACQNG